MITTTYDWVSQHSHLLSMVAAGSVILLLISIIATPWIVSLLPEDYLARHDPRSHKHPLARLLIDVVRTLIGASLIVSGMVMLVIPGPGLVTLVLGISLARFPGKRRLLHKVATHRAVFASLNWMRQRHGKPPLQHPGKN